MVRKLTITTIVVTILLVANLPVIISSHENPGLTPVARHLRCEFLTGITMAAVIALIVLLSHRTIVGQRLEASGRICSLCDLPLGEHSRYCPRCGSRAA